MFSDLHLDLLLILNPYTYISLLEQSLQFLVIQWPLERFHRPVPHHQVFPDRAVVTLAVIGPTPWPAPWPRPPCRRRRCRRAGSHGVLRHLLGYVQYTGSTRGTTRVLARLYGSTGRAAGRWTRAGKGGRRHLVPAGNIRRQVRGRVRTVGRIRKFRKSAIRIWRHIVFGLQCTIFV